MIIYQADFRHGLHRFVTDFYFQMNGVCHVELVETSHVAHEEVLHETFDYAQSDRHICGHLVKSVLSVCHPNSFIIYD